MSDEKDAPVVGQELMGFAAQIQKPLSEGPMASEAGLLALGADMTPIGAVLILSLKHPDGTGLAAILGVEERQILMDLLEGTMEKVIALGRPKMAPRGKPN